MEDFLLVLVAFACLAALSWDIYQGQQELRKQDAHQTIHRTQDAGDNHDRRI